MFRGSSACIAIDSSAQKNGTILWFVVAKDDTIPPVAATVVTQLVTGDARVLLLSVAVAEAVGIVVTTPLLSF